MEHERARAHPHSCVCHDLCLIKMKRRASACAVGDSAKMFPVFLLSAASLSGTTSDAVTSLPTYGKVHGKQYAGFAAVTPDGHNKLHYWFVESDAGNKPDTPLLMWLNGGPGASSLTGLLAEKLGPQSIATNGTLVDNPDRITKTHHLLTLDNPVGSGYSSTSSGSYVTSEAQMRTQAVAALRVFFKRHPEYASNPFWVTGESYAGHYVPNIAWEVAVNASEIPLQGVVIGNGMYNMALQYPSVGQMAYAAGAIDESTLAQMEARQDACVAKVASEPATAGEFCENVTVYWLFSDAVAGELFYYDVGMADGHFFDDITKAMGTYLNRADVKGAVHAEGATWTQSDEKGPVAAALLPDWTVNSDVVVAKLLELGYAVNMYNGVRDLSSCNHIGNEKVLAELCKPDTSPCAGYAAQPSKPWPSAKMTEGYVRRSGNLTYATVLRTGHLVPTVVPKAFSTLLSMFIGTSSRRA